MNVEKRIELLIRLGEYILSDGAEWKTAKEKAAEKNGWFIQEFINYSANSIAHHFLHPDKLRAFAHHYEVAENHHPKKIGLVMAGNIPLVGFHDWMCIFLTGHQAMIKPSSKDELLITHLTEQMNCWEPESGRQTGFSAMLKGCDAYIATGSNNSARYFDYYFSKYPHIIRHNRTSVAVLSGKESMEELDRLADDVHLFFGLGCRNVTKVFIPRGYDFVPVLNAFRKYAYFSDHNKYKNNYDYQLALHLINNIYYMTNGSIILSENDSAFSPISQLNYAFYDSPEQLNAMLSNQDEIQCIAGQHHVPFGQAQTPAISDFADGVNTMHFLLSL